MITLSQAIKLLDLNDSDIVCLCKKRFDRDGQLISVKALREKYDMRKITVTKIYPYHFQYDPDDDTYELIIK